MIGVQYGIAILGMGRRYFVQWVKSPISRDMYHFPK